MHAAQEVAPDAPLRPRCSGTPVARAGVGVRSAARRVQAAAGMAAGVPVVQVAAGSGGRLAVLAMARQGELGYYSQGALMMVIQRLADQNQGRWFLVIVRLAAQPRMPRQLAARSAGPRVAGSRQVAVDYPWSCYRQCGRKSCAEAAYLHRLGTRDVGCLAQSTVWGCCDGVLGLRRRRVKPRYTADATTSAGPVASLRAVLVE